MAQYPGPPDSSHLESLPSLGTNTSFSGHPGHSLPLESGPVALQSPTKFRSFSSLPIEIIEMIVLSVRAISAGENKQLRERRAERITRLPIRGDPKEFYEICLHNEVPLLNTLQSLAAVNRELHQLSCPWLWKTLTFPTDLPLPMKLWTEDILPRHAHLVQSLSVEIGSDTLDKPLHMSFQESRYDNTRWTGCDEQTLLTPQSIFTLLEQCPGLHEFKLVLPEYDYYDDPDFGRHFEFFNSRVIHLLLGMSQFRHLLLENGSSMDEQVIVQFIEELPLLDSVSLSGFLWSSYEDGAITLGRHMSQLKYLTRMYLSSISSLDARWCQFTWTGLLTDVSILKCSKITPTEFHQVIHHIAPNVTTLQYRPDGHQHYNDAAKAQWDTIHQFRLPALTNLSLAVDNTCPTMLTGFTSCRNIQQLRYDSGGLSSNWDLVRSLVTRSLWSKLNCIKLADSTSEVTNNKKEMQSCCELAGIHVVFHHELHGPSDDQFTY